ncbi:MAG: tRNA lysidine(34) synthetase TilS [Hyphomicrobiaceae bacterium]
MSAGPIAESELAGLFSGFEDLQAIGLAVSGGPDSMGLMHLYARWRQLYRPDQRAMVLTVDHGLRPESAAESAAVVEAARQLGFTAEALHWTGSKPMTGIQEAARAARYRLLGEAARRHGLDGLVTAHTEDDQAETLLMRLARGSGLDGLAGMANATRIGDSSVRRPLLGVAKSRLMATLDAKGVSYSVDPSNTDPRFERPRLRAVWPALESIGLTASRLARSAGRLERARQALEMVSDQWAGMAVTVDACGVATVDVQLLADAPEEIVVRLIQRLVASVGGSDAPPSLAKIESLAGWLVVAQEGGRTLGRTIVTLACNGGGRRAAFCRETGREPLPVVSLGPGETLLWDGRFHVTLEAGRDPVEVRPHAPDGGGRDAPWALAATPVAVRDGVVVASLLAPDASERAGIRLAFAGRDAIFAAGDTRKPKNKPKTGR